MLKMMVLSVVAAIATIVSVITTGCKSLPAPEKLEQKSYAIGIAAAFVADTAIKDGDVRETVVSVIEEVSKLVPETNTTFEATWMPVAAKAIAKAVEDGKLNVRQAKAVEAAALIAAKGADYLVCVRYPKLLTYKDLADIAVKAFADGFVSYFKSSEDCSSCTIAMDADEYAVEHLAAARAISK